MQCSSRKSEEEKIAPSLQQNVQLSVMAGTGNVGERLFGEASM
jgi:hypothetical protein